MKKSDIIFIAGATGLVGNALKRILIDYGYNNLLIPSRQELDLTNKNQIINYFRTFKPTHVFLCAAKVGGILANKKAPADFISQNIAIQSNVIEISHKFNIEKLIFLGSSCIYPKHAPQPLKEDYLLTGPLEETNKPYAISKIAGIIMCQAYMDQFNCNFISAMPSNLYGTHDNFNLENSHLLPALIRKFHIAKTTKSDAVELWGTGEPYREFLHVNDLARALIMIMDRYNERDPINVGTGSDIKIKELATLVAKIVEFKGSIIWDTTKPDGTPRKLLDIAKIWDLGWRPEINLITGIESTYKWWLNNQTKRI